MNKAEEQYLYQFGWTKAKGDVMTLWGLEEAEFIKRVKDYCEKRKRAYDAGSIFALQGACDFFNSIIHAIDGGQITDWPSFVEYMTGEDYEQKPKCEYCNDTKEVPAPHYSSKGDIPDCDFIRCPKCGVDDE